MTRKLQIMCLTAFALVGFIGSGNCVNREQCAKTCWADNNPKGKCGLNHSAGKKYMGCAKEFCECWTACQAEH